MFEVSGECHCGNIRIQLGLLNTPASYNPRVCDCDFCTTHGAAYISDAQGYLRLRVADPLQSSTFRQGDELAEMLHCSRCGALVGATYRESGQTFATVNVRLIRGTAFGAEQPVSPKNLSGGEKVLRWAELWFRDVRIS
jgi:hypothetical protein